MKINWTNVIEMIIALAIAFLLNEFVIAPLADKFIPKITSAFEGLFNEQIAR